MTETTDRLSELFGGADSIDCGKLLEDFIHELSASEGGEKSSLSFIPSYLSPRPGADHPLRVAAVDAGGTNLRIAVLESREGSVPSIVSVKKYPMPGRDTPLSADEFFDTLAEMIDNDAPGIADVGVSFAYKGQITPEGDYIIEGMCKEVTVSGIEGRSLAGGLNDAFVRRGSAKRRIRTVNDTAACLMGSLPREKLFSCGAAVGMVLGTGFNICYRMDVRSDDDIAPDIIVTESGFFDKIPREWVDLELDRGSAIPGDHIAEKMISGRYLSEIFNRLMDRAEREGMSVSPERAGDSSYLDALLRGPEDDSFERRAAARIVRRSAMIASVCVAASALYSMREGGSDAVIVVEGSTVLRMCGFLDIFTGMLDKILTEQRGITYEIFSGDDSVLTGTAGAAMM